jgi:preprotein translocase subunit SecB|tara:strand:+ start:18 stop:446 length:429 start_codon:yes stop_codon:yes gene_type:complete
MKMTENFKIIGNFVKDMSSETPDVPTYIFVKDKISTYQLNIDINSKAVKDGIIEVNTIIKFMDKPEVQKKAHFEVTYTSIVKVNEKISDKKDMEKIILCDVPNEIYPDLKRIFLNLLTESGYPGIKFEKKIDFTELYNQRSN